jgi:hypothetical protein
MSEVANTFKVIGLLTKIFPTERKSDKFQCREFVIEIPSQYPEFVKFQLVQDYCDIINDQFSEGSTEVEVSFNLRGREWQGKYFTTLNAWKVKKLKDVEVQEMPDQTPSEQVVPFQIFTPTFVKLPKGEPLKASYTDDLPF